jgi:putative zinc finger protein
VTAAHPFEHDDAAYVLGALSHEERIAYEEHLRGCPRCSAAVAELAVLPGLLGRLPGVPAPGAAAEPPPDTLLAGILAAVRRRRTTRRLAGAVAAVAAAVLLVAVTVGVTGRSAAPTAPTAAGTAVTLSRVADVPVDADLRLQGVAWGTRITMTCRYHGPEPGGSSEAGPYDPGAGDTYQLVVVSAADRTTQSVATWHVLPGRDAAVAGSTDLFPEQIAEVQLRDGSGTVLLAGSPSR